MRELIKENVMIERMEKGMSEGSKGKKDDRNKERSNERKIQRKRKIIQTRKGEGSREENKRKKGNTYSEEERWKGMPLEVERKKNEKKIHEGSGIISYNLDMTADSPLYSLIIPPPPHYHNHHHHHYHTQDHSFPSSHCHLPRHYYYYKQMQLPLLIPMTFFL